MRRYLLSTCVAAVALLSAPLGSALGQERRQVPALRTYGEPARPDDATGIQQLIDQFRGAWGRQDTAALMALHADDVEWINAYARMFQGAAALAEFLEVRLFPAFSPDVSREEAADMRLISVRYMDDAAVVHMYTDGARGPSRNDGEEMRRTHLHLVLERRTAGWRIVHTAIMDAR